MTKSCTYGFTGQSLLCPAAPWCGCEPNLPKPLPDPEQLDLWEDE